MRLMKCYHFYYVLPINMSLNKLNLNNQCGWTGVESKNKTFREFQPSMLRKAILNYCFFFIPLYNKVTLKFLQVFFATYDIN